jgi:PleD family two-component response regulator
LLAIPEIATGDDLSMAAKHAAASAIHRVSRSVDIAGWLGSEHILFVLPETGDQEARAAARRLEEEMFDRSSHVGGQRWQLHTVDGVHTTTDAGELIVHAIRQHVLPKSDD